MKAHNTKTRKRDNEQLKTLYEDLVSQWPSSIVSRSELGIFSGGVLHPRTVANWDSRGEGITPSYRCGRKIFYRSSDVARFIIEKLED